MMSSETQEHFTAVRRRIFCVVARHFLEGGGDEGLVFPVSVGSGKRVGGAAHEGEEFGAQGFDFFASRGVGDEMSACVRSSGP